MTPADTLKQEQRLAGEVEAIYDRFQSLPADIAETLPLPDLLLLHCLLSDLALGLEAIGRGLLAIFGETHILKSVKMASDLLNRIEGKEEDED